LVTHQPQLAPSHCEPDQLEPLQLEPLHELPLQELPLQELPDQLEPLQELPDQTRSLQLEPLHELPDQLEPLQELPDHELPDQLEPFQTPPDQLEPAASSAAMTAELKGWPKMSCSPWSTTPFIETWSLPREASRLPIPVDGALYCCEANTEGTDAFRSLFRSSSPHPCCFQL
jgi:hypothetical protein